MNWISAPKKSSKLQRSNQLRMVFRMKILSSSLSTSRSKIKSSKFKQLTREVSKILARWRSRTLPHMVASVQALITRPSGQASRMLARTSRWIRLRQRKFSTLTKLIRLKLLKAMVAISKLLAESYLSLIRCKSSKFCKKTLIWNNTWCNRKNLPKLITWPSTTCYRIESNRQQRAVTFWSSSFESSFVSLRALSEKKSKEFSNADRISRRDWPNAQPSLALSLTRATSA